MDSLILMYVYFDKSGNIKAITPRENENFDSSYQYIMLPLTQVQPFLLGEQNTFDYLVRSVFKDGVESLSLVRKVTPIPKNVIRALDNYLCKVPTFDRDNLIRIVADDFRKKVSISLTNKFKEAISDLDNLDNEKCKDFLSSGTSIIYITEKNNPYSLIMAIEFLPNNLLQNNVLEYSCRKDINLLNSSAYTKRLISGYSYTIRD